MKKILAIGGSNSRKSMNKILAAFIANKIEHSVVTVIGLDDIELPLYGPDLEAQKGVHENAHKFKALVESADAIVLSMAEYNGLHATAFKNLWDWTSRIEQKFWANKPIFLAAASPGGRGGIGVLEVTKNLIPHFGGNVIVDFSFPSFHQNFQDNNITNSELADTLASKIQTFQKAI